MIMISIIISNLLLWWNIIQNDTVEKYNMIWDAVEHNMIQETRWCNVGLNTARCPLGQIIWTYLVQSDNDYQTIIVIATTASTI